MAIKTFTTGEVLTAADNNPYLILDDAEYGKLDTNRLSF